MKNIALVIIFFSSVIFCQSRDTSFTLYNTALKVIKQYPYAKLVLPKLPKGVHEKKDIVYTCYGNRNMHLDLYSPEKKNKLCPAVLLIHGGGWRSGDKEMEIPRAQFLASKGYIAATVEYRLSIEALYPAALIDLKAAICWLKANSGLYNIDSNKIALYGCSSGGQLAALLGISNENYPDNDFQLPNPPSTITNHSSFVQAVIDIDGVLDMTDPNESGKDTVPSKPSSAKYWLGYTFHDKPEIWKEASALNYANNKSAPICFINSSIPRFHAGRDELISKLKNLGIYSEVHLIHNTPHTFWLFHPWFDLASRYVINYLDKMFKLNKK
ncbi:MAG: alpha/beta hydrolase [Ignavibacteriaceae bacterium]|nr:alpha/beta hydrolase [Ignavibacteriaceae bacterium]